jgi:uncharacterized protein (TIGR00661 family)
MKVLYAFQGTGNGHLSRAREVIPALLNRVSVDVMISGTQADLELNFPIKYNYDGISFIFGKSGGVDIPKTFKHNFIRRIIKEVRNCPVTDYDLVINDFEPISAWACKIRGVKCISLSHQSALLSNLVPLPTHQDKIGSFILRHYAPCKERFSFHFEKYDADIYTPIIRSEIRDKEIIDLGHYTVYLPSYSDKKIIKILSKLVDVRWHVFSKHAKSAYQRHNVQIEPITNERFCVSLASCRGVLCGAGFETPSEALYMSKKLMVIPMKRQYEQYYNAESLRKMGIPIINKLGKKNVWEIRKWVESEMTIPVYYPDQTQIIIDRIIERYIESAINEYSGINLAPQSVYVSS